MIVKTTYYEHLLKNYFKSPYVRKFLVSNLPHGSFVSFGNKKYYLKNRRTSGVYYFVKPPYADRIKKGLVNHIIVPSAKQILTNKDFKNPFPC